MQRNGHAVVQGDGIAGLPAAGCSPRPTTASRSSNWTSSRTQTPRGATYRKAGTRTSSCPVAQALDELLPGVFDELTRGGAVPVEPLVDLRATRGVPLARGTAPGGAGPPRADMDLDAGSRAVVGHRRCRACGGMGPAAGRVPGRGGRGCAGGRRALGAAASACPMCAYPVRRRRRYFPCRMCPRRAPGTLFDAAGSRCPNRFSPNGVNPPNRGRLRRVISGCAAGPCWRSETGEQCRASSRIRPRATGRRM